MCFIYKEIFKHFIYQNRILVNSEHTGLALKRFQER